jgi:hypothetical protein
MLSCRASPPGRARLGLQLRRLQRALSGRDGMLLLLLLPLLLMWLRNQFMNTTQRSGTAGESIVVELDVCMAEICAI